MRTFIPVEPDADTAREWARDELAKPEYSQDGTNWLLRLLDWIAELLDGVSGPSLGTGGGVPIGTILLILAIIGLVLWLVIGPLRRIRRREREHSVFDDDYRTSTQMLDDATRWAHDGDWSRAMLDMYRVTVRSLEERDVLSDRPGMTAHEAAVETGVAFPDVADTMLHDADVFDEIRYGDRVGTEQDFLHARATYRSLKGRSRLEMAT